MIEKKKKKKRTRIILLSLLALLIIFRLMLPYIVLKYVNNTLSELKEYYGHVEDIDIALYRGAYIIKDIRLDRRVEKTGKKDTIPFFRSSEIDLSVEWSAIFKGAIVGEIYVDAPVLNFVKGKHKNEDVRADTADFRELIDDLMPLSINRFGITKGQIHYIDQGSNPRVDIAMKNIEVTATNLSNVNDSAKLLPAHLAATANAYGGKLELNVDFDALNRVPTFDMNARVSHVNMVNLNNFFKAYGNFDVKKGRFGLYTEFAAKEGKFKGYVKPIIKDLDVVQWNKEEGNVGQILWETLVGTVAEVFQNQKEEQLATKVPIQGSFDNPEAGLWEAISYVLRNAFVNALKPSIDNTINIGNVEAEEDNRTFLQKVFGKKKDKEDGGEKPK
jgi:hypothetical protein